MHPVQRSQATPGVRHQYYEGSVSGGYGADDAARKPRRCGTAKEASLRQTAHRSQEQHQTKNYHDSYDECVCVDGMLHLGTHRHLARHPQGGRALATTLQATTAVGPSRRCKCKQADISRGTGTEQAIRCSVSFHQG